MLLSLPTDHSKDKSLCASYTLSWPLLLLHHWEHYPIPYRKFAVEIQKSSQLFDAILYLLARNIEIQLL